MKAEDADFLDGFLRKSVGAQYVIPVYQRNYNWKKDEQLLFMSRITLQCQHAKVSTGIVVSFVRTFLHLFLITFVCGIPWFIALDRFNPALVCYC